jgi:3-phosphoshikimate 1-carboxyvinyltransferase
VNFGGLTAMENPDQSSDTQRIIPLDRQRARTLTLACPPDKSLTHRALILASLAKGKSHINGPLLGADCLSTLQCLAQLGVKYEVKPGQILVNSEGWDEFSSPHQPLDFGNSGTTARLLLGVFAASPSLFVTAFGDGSLSQRPMGRVVVPLCRMGASIWGRKGGGFLPLAIRGERLKAQDHKVDKASAQVKSALLLAGLNIEGYTSVTLPTGSRNHTEIMLKALGAKCVLHHEKDEEKVIVKGPFRPQARDYTICGDPSSAAFFCVLAGLLPKCKLTITNVLDNSTRCGFIQILKRMGFDLDLTANPNPKKAIESQVDLNVKHSKDIKSVNVEKSLIPSLIDEIPVLALACSFAKGRSRFHSVAELRIKESDRLAKTIELISLIGGKAFADGDDLVVEGGVKEPQSFTFDSKGDHRLAMTAAIAGCLTSNGSEIIGSRCVNVSFPDFYDILQTKFLGYETE